MSKESLKVVCDGTTKSIEIGDEPMPDVGDRSKTGTSVGRPWWLLNCS